jgi:ubiquinone/menaquinone biosynthesis C-methylase UbiE
MKQRPILFCYEILFVLSIVYHVAISFTVLFPLGTNQYHDRTNTMLKSTTTVSLDEKRTIQKNKLYDLLKVNPIDDPILADPYTKEGLIITTQGSTIIGGTTNNKAKYVLKSSTNTYEGSSDSYINLLEPIVAKTTTSNTSFNTSEIVNEVASSVMKTFTPFIPPPVRSLLSNIGLPLTSYIPMRDLFTSPSVSYAYERGWRQGFTRAGFPGPDKEAEMAMNYFEPSMMKYNTTRVVVDMSCATGLFTRRFVKSAKYKRVFGCDYSESMLLQARQFINQDPDIITKNRMTQLELIRLDVGQIPMKNESIDALHAGAAMHCWPELVKAVSEIHRVLKPGGRYFATTFLASYFSMISQADNIANAGPSLQAFQYFASVDQLRSLLMEGGFQDENISIEVLGNACIVIRCEK